MPLPKTEKIETIASPLALIVGESQITNTLSQKLRDGGCEVIESEAFPKSGKFNYLFQFGGVSKVKDSYLKYLKTAGKFLFIDYQSENITEIAKLDRIKILRVENLNPWYFQKLSDEILKIAFTHSTKNIIDIRLQDKLPESSLIDPDLKKNKILLPLKKTASVKNQPQENIISQLPKKYVRKKISPFILWPLIIFTILLFFLSVLTYWQVNQVRQIIDNAQKHFASSEISLLTYDLDQLKNKVISAQNVYNNLNTPLNPFRNIGVFRNTGRLFVSADQFLTTGINTLSLIESITASDQALMLKDLNISKEKYQQIIDTFNLLSQSTENLKSDINLQAIPFFPQESLSSFLDNTTNQINALSYLLPPFKEIFFNGHKIYLLLLQNNMELRPTGGFIGSVGLLDLQDGKMNNLDILDVYTIDGQLKGHVDPPDPIRKYFNQPNWFLRDSNFDPDFASSAVQAEWFLDKTIQKKVDGVIGLNLLLVQDLLTVLGPLTLADFNNEVITSDNLFIKAQLYINQQFFAGSTSKKDFLKSISDSLQKRLTGKNISYLKLFQIIKKSLEEKNLQFYFNDVNVQKKVEDYGWAGRVFNIKCLNVNQVCFPDYIFINESNFGVNKANFFVKKAVFIDKKINVNGQIITDLTLKYDNQSQAGLLQGGQYTNYLRLFLPKNSVLINSEVNGQKIESVSFDVTSYQEDKTIFGFLLKIPENSTSEFKFSYLLPENLRDEHKIYQFYFQKQAGDKTSAVNMSFASSKFVLSPFNFKAKESGGDLLIFTTDSSVDRLFQLKLSLP